MPQNFKKIIDSSLELLIPSHCLVCKQTLKNTTLCRNCKPKKINSSFARCKKCYTSILSTEKNICRICELKPLGFTSRYLWEYDLTTRALIHSAKYNPSRKLCYYLGEIINKNLNLLYSQIPEFDAIIPVPCSYEGYKQRGFNQSEIIAKPSSKNLAIKIISNCLKRKKHIKAQSSFEKHSQRIANIKDAYYLEYEPRVKNILIIDDVLTTGATIKNISKLFHRSINIHFITLARSNAWLEFRQQIVNN